MKTFAAPAVCVLCLLFSGSNPVQSQEEPTIDGYVIRVASKSDFDVNGISVKCGAKTRSVALDPSGTGPANQGCPADRIAAVLEKEEYRLQPANRTALAALYGGMILPFAGPALQVGGLALASQTIAEAEHQCERVGVGLLHDAGYDIDQAPLAWWLLAKKKPSPLSEIPISDRASYVYRMLGESWSNPAIFNPPKP